MSDPAVAFIRAAYPDLALVHVRRVESGQHNVVLIADEAQIFRFPRFRSGVARLQVECALLDAIRPYISLPLPDPRWRSFVPPTPGQAFAGYPTLPGEPLRREQVAMLWDRATLAGLATQLAGFLQQLHAISVEALPHGTPLAWGFTAPDWQAGCRELCDRIADKVLSRLDTLIRRRLLAEFAAFLDDDGNFASPLALIHGDFGTGNLLWSPERGEITGVLDFGSAGLGDPACDIAAWLTYGEEFVALGLDAYPELTVLLPRARFFRRTFALQEALYGVEHDDEAAFARGIAPYLHADGG